MSTYSLLDKLPLVIQSDGLNVSNLCIRFSIIEKIKSSTALFYYIQVKDGQKPEDIAYEQYGTQDLYWLVLLMNDMIDPYYDWVLSDTDLYKLCQRKYGVDSVYSTHHYEATEFSPLDEGTWVGQGSDFSIPISNWSYENNLNELKRKIKILNPVYVPQVLSDLKKEIQAISVNNNNV